MATRPRRVTVLALAFLLVACGAQVAAPRPSAAPELTRTATPRPTNASSDVLYVRSIGGYAQGSILVIDARTGATLRKMPDGAVSPDRSTLYWAESVNGATQTALHVADLATGRDLRTFTIDGDLRPSPFTGSIYELLGDKLSRDGRRLVLINSPYKNEKGWVTRLAVLETSSGEVAGSTELVTPSTFGVLAPSPDGRSVFLDAYGAGAATMWAFDVESRALAAVVGPGISANGFRTAGVLSPDGRWLFRVDGGDNSVGPYVVALDLLARRSSTIPLVTQLNSWGELWSVALTADGSALYAVNPALGVVNEIDPRQLAVRRSSSIPVSRLGDGLAAIGQLLFPVAEAKRVMQGGAALSPDGHTLYAAGNSGISVIDTATLTVREPIWRAGYSFELLSLSADGRRLYAVDNSTRNLLMFDTQARAFLGAISLDSYVPGIVRIDSAP
jgi:DNA-binding beta-propeller fold protein YncE